MIFTQRREKKARHKRKYRPHILQRKAGRKFAVVNADADNHKQNE